MPYQSEYQKLMTDLNTALHHNPNLAQRVEGYIDSLIKQKNNAHKQFLDAHWKLQETDYVAENQKKVIENTGKTLKRYETENRALRELVSLWI